MTEKNVPKATLQRYPVYLKALRKLKSSGVERIMSKELASVCLLYTSEIESQTHSLWTGFIANRVISNSYLVVA